MPFSLRRRPQRTPIRMQLEETDCGAASLGIVLAHYGCYVSLEELRETCGVGRDGSNLEEIAKAARTYGLTATGQSCQIRKLADLPMPMIIFWGFNHFVVLEGVRGSNFYINDPAQGHRVMGFPDFSQEFTGVGLVIEKGLDFQSRGSRTGALQKIWPWLSEHKSLLIRTVFLGLLLTLAALALPVLLSMYVDQFLEAGERDWNVALIGSTFAIGLLVYLLTWLQLRLLRTLIIRISTGQAVVYLDKLIQLPMRFFAHRFAGDLSMRMRKIDQIADSGVRHLVLIAVDSTMSVVFLVAMMIWHWTLALLVLGLGVGCVLLTRLLAHLRRDKNHRLRREQGMLAGVTASALTQIEWLQATGRQHDFFVEWSGRQARELRARQQFVELGHVATSLPLLFQLLVAATVFGFGGWMVMNEGLTIGELMGLYVLAINFIGPVSRSAQFSDVLETLDADLERLSDVVKAPFDTVLKEAPVEDRSVLSLEGRLRLVGRLEMRGVTFGYQRNREPLIKDFDLVIEPGQRVAVVGPSGSGKSTLALLAAGLYRSWSGDVLFDGHTIDDIPREVFCRSVALVDQNPVLFAGSIHENLTMWDTSIPHHFVIAAARDATIHEDILSRSLGYASVVEEGGHNFSGGQRLRLELARALVNSPSLLILDEATSALDAVTELMVDDRIRQRGCSCLIIAHRLSTVRDADQIIVMDKGRVLEKGTHDDLYADDGFYRRLIDGE